VKPWHTVTFDFIVKLPKTSRANDSIRVFVDKLSKLVHFVACKEEVSAKEFAAQALRRPCLSSSWVKS
jgi:hypothetical protein